MENFVYYLPDLTWLDLFINLNLGLIFIHSLHTVLYLKLEVILELWSFTLSHESSLRSCWGSPWSCGVRRLTLKPLSSSWILGGLPRTLKALTRALEACSGVMDAYPTVVDDHSEAKEVHFEAVEANPELWRLILSYGSQCCGHGGTLMQ